MTVHSDYLGTIFFGTIVGSYIAVALFRALARRWGILDIPNDRSSHHRAVPLCGGVVLVAINLIAWVAYGVIDWRVPSPHLIAIAAGGVIVAAVSLVDDLRHVQYGYRFLAHFTGATLVVAGFGYLHSIDLPVVGTVEFGLAGAVLTVFWIVGLINAFNFMDGVDGMAAGQASIAGLGWSGLGLLTGQPTLTLFGAVLAASSIGFLAHNWQPATIFMGDVGSTFFGYSFALVPILGARHDSRLALVGVLLVWPAIFDPGFTVIRRLRRRQNIFAGHREFLFHRLVASGWSHAAAASFYASLPLAGAVLAFTWERADKPLHALAGLCVIALCAGLWLMVRRQERRVQEPPPAVLALLEGAERARGEDRSLLLEA